MNVGSPIVDRELLAVRDALAREAWIPVLTASRCARPIRTGEAERELARVHLAEVARLLREAALLRCDASSQRLDAESVQCEARWQQCGASLPRLRAWRRRARTEIAQWRVDGFESPALLRSCASSAIERWPSARQIAVAALALEPSDSARLCVARADVAEGRAADAVRMIEALLARDLDRSVRRAAVRALAGADRRAR